MDSGPLVAEQVEAGARFLNEFQKYAPIQAAFWLKESDASNAHLCVASDRITDENFDLAYDEVARIRGQLQDPWLDLFSVRVLRDRHRPLVEAVLGLIRRFGGKTPIHLYGQILAGRSVDELYVYPSVIPAEVQ